jgi:hypothetical protein
MRKIFLLFIFLSFITITISAQSYTISGSIEDLKTGEHLLSANAFDANTLKGTTTNYYGFYSLKLPAGPIKLTYSYAGYQSIVLEFVLNKDTIINPKLDPTTVINEVVVTSNQRNIARNNQMGMVEMTAIQTKKLPVFAGESDILKTIQLLPGIKGGTEGTSGFYVRGGGPDQNLILLDGVPIYNASHLFGFFSVFNSDAIQNFTILKGGFPARYGGRLSSVLDIKMKEGNNKKFGGEASIGLISSKLTLEGPVVNENTSFIVSARRTYIDVLPYLYLKSINSDVIGGYYFYDINAKINHKFSDRSRLYYSLYHGIDKFYMNSEYENDYDFNERTSIANAGSGWGNTIQALRWNYVISDNLFCNSTATYSNYNFFINLYNEEKENGKKNILSYDYTSGITDWTGRLDFDFIPNTENYIKFGANFTNHTFNPGVNAFQIKGQNELTNDIDTTFGNNEINAQDIIFYFEDDIDITSKLKVNVGIHYSLFNVKGQTYNSFQPRISGRYLITDNFSAKASVVQMKQYIHLLTNSGIGLPTDLWVPATNKLKPMDSWQTSIGFAYNLNSMYEFSIESYYKPMFNLIEYKEGASFLSQGNDWETKVETGRGWAKGIEILINKTSGKTTGWIGYTLSQTDRQFSEISEGKVFPYKYDRRHDIGIAITHKPSENFDFGIVWVYGTGTATTLAEEKYPSKGMFNNNNMFFYDSRMIEYFSTRNSYRMPAYHRLDLGFNFNKKIRWGMRTWSFGAYNAYNHQNPFFLFFSNNKGEGINLFGSSSSERMYLKQISIFPIIPYVKYSVKF